MSEGAKSESRVVVEKTTYSLPQVVDDLINHVAFAAESIDVALGSIKKVGLLADISELVKATTQLVKVHTEKARLELAHNQEVARHVKEHQQVLESQDKRLQNLENKGRGTWRDSKSVSNRAASPEPTQPVMVTARIQKKEEVPVKQGGTDTERSRQETSRSVKNSQIER